MGYPQQGTPSWTPATDNNNPADMWFFDSISDPPPRDPLDPNDPNDLNLSSTNLTSWGLANYKTYYQVDYSLSLPNNPSINTLVRNVTVLDYTAPVFQFNTLPSNYDIDQGDPDGTGARNESDAKKKFIYTENYWFVDIENIDGTKPPTNASGNSPGESIINAREGFEVMDVKYKHQVGL